MKMRRLVILVFLVLIGKFAYGANDYGIELTNDNIDKNIGNVKDEALKYLLKICFYPERATAKNKDSEYIYKIEDKIISINNYKIAMVQEKKEYNGFNEIKDEYYVCMIYLSIYKNPELSADLLILLSKNMKGNKIFDYQRVGYNELLLEQLILSYPNSVPASFALEILDETDKTSFPGRPNYQKDKLIKLLGALGSSEINTYLEKYNIFKKVWDKNAIIDKVELEVYKELNNKKNSDLIAVVRDQKVNKTYLLLYEKIDNQYIFKWSDTIEQDFFGHQSAEIAFKDINGDGQDELILELTNDSSGNHSGDGGVYIYYYLIGKENKRILDILEYTYTWGSDKETSARENNGWEISYSSQNNLGQIILKWKDETFNNAFPDPNKKPEKIKYNKLERIYTWNGKSFDLSVIIEGVKHDGLEYYSGVLKSESADTTGKLAAMDILLQINDKRFSKPMIAKCLLDHLVSLSKKKKTVDYFTWDGQESNNRMLIKKIADIAAKGTAAELIRLVADKKLNDWTREYAALILAKMEYRYANNLFLEILRDENKSWAALALSEMNSLEALDVIIKLGLDPSNSDREVFMLDIIESLGRYRNRKSMDALMIIGNNKNKMIWQHAVKTIGEVLGEEVNTTEDLDRFKKVMQVRVKNAFAK